MQKKKIVILGSTGSIGQQALSVIRGMKESIEVLGLAAGKKWELLADQVKEFSPRIVSVSGLDVAKKLKEVIRACKIEVFCGTDGLCQVAALPEADLVLNAVTGVIGLMPTIAAINAGKDIALANKETLVAAGFLVMRMSKKKGVTVIPVDSEHSAIWQCLRGEGKNKVARIILTASGGPFRTFPVEKLATITTEMALNHPNWQMGPKVTVDSATLMNKGLEIIEARWLFEVDYPQIEVIVHRQSIIHSMVEFIDGSILAQLAAPDMRLPIQYALTYPERRESCLPRLDFSSLRELTFEPPDFKKFPCLSLARRAGETGGTMPAVLNAANEVAVAAFLKGEISFPDIPRLVETVMNRHKVLPGYELEEILAADQWARQEALHCI